MKNKVYPVKYAKQSSISPFLKSHIESFPNLRFKQTINH